jgi:hypothetical protein
MTSPAAVAALALARLSDPQLRVFLQLVISQDARADGLLTPVCEQWGVPRDVLDFAMISEAASRWLKSQEKNA